MCGRPTFATFGPKRISSLVAGFPSHVLFSSQNLGQKVCVRMRLVPSLALQPTEGAFDNQFSPPLFSGPESSRCCHYQSLCNPSCVPPGVMEEVHRTRGWIYQFLDHRFHSTCCIYCTEHSLQTPLTLWQHCWLTTRIRSSELQPVASIMFSACYLYTNTFLYPQWRDIITRLLMRHELPVLLVGGADWHHMICIERVI